MTASGAAWTGDEVAAAAVAAVVPARVAGPDQVGRRGYPAGIISRGVAFSVDLLVLFLLWSTGVYVIQAAASAIDLDVDVSAVVQVVGASMWLLFLLVVYHTGFTALFGRTPGKILMGLQVVRLDGSPMHVGRSLLRTLAYALSAILMLGFAWIAIDNRRQGWHDKIAKTVVVYEWEPRARPRR